MKNKRINGLLHEATKIEPTQIVTLSFRPPLGEVVTWRIVCTAPLPDNDPLFSTKGEKWADDKGSFFDYVFVPLPSDAISALRAEAVENEERAFTLSDYRPAFKAAGNPLYTCDRWNYYVWRPIPDPEPEKIKVSLHAIGLLLGNPERGKQLGLFTAHNRQDMSGLSDLSYNELRAFLAVAKLSYKKEPASVRAAATAGTYQDMGEQVIIPRITFTHAEYLEAYGLEKGKNGRFPRASRDAAMLALEELHTKKRELWYERKYKEGKKNKVEAIHWSTTIIPSMATLYRGMTEEESRQVKDGKKRRPVGLSIDIHYMFVDQINSFYVLLEDNLHKKVAEAVAEIRGSKKGRPSTYHYLFILWLSRLNSDVWEIKRSTLADVLRQGYRVANRQGSRLDKAIAEAIEVAERMGYLAGYETLEAANGEVKYRFTRNAEKFTRRKQLKEPK